jgi:hypothetical protein
MTFYVVLILMMLLGVGVVMFFDFARDVRIIAVVILAMAYIVWGGVYHFFKKDLHLKLLWEYVLVAGMAAMVVTFLLWRG